MSNKVKKSEKSAKSASSAATSYRSKSRSSSRTTSRTSSSRSSRSRSSSRGSTTKRSNARSRSYSSSSYESARNTKNRSRSVSSDKTRSRSRSSSRSRSRSSSREKPAKKGQQGKEKRSSSEQRSNWSDPMTPGVSQASSGASRWRKSEPKYEPRYPMYGLNPMKLEGARRDTTNYYIHRRKVAEVKSRVDNRPPTIYPHVYCNMKKLKKQQEERALIERNNQFLLSKLYVAATTTRVDNKNQGRDSYLRDRQRNQRRWEELRQTSSQLASRQVSTNQSRRRNMDYN